MKHFEKFYIEWFEFNETNKIASFFYSFDKIVKFTEKIDFSVPFMQVRVDFEKDNMDTFIFSLSLAIWISYYKAYPTKDLIVESWFLETEDILFWKKFYKSGLWEFLFRNNLNPDNYFNFVVTSNKKYEKKDFHLSEKSLLPIGGWKDSIVSLKILEKLGKEYTPIVFWKIDPIKENCLKIIGKDYILVKRKMSQTLFDLIDNWYYNGHVPITWIISFVLLATAYLYDYRYIILSNEKSANVWNAKIGDLEVNHQWSKSLDFEKEFSKYITRNLSSNLRYFSILRGMYEIPIAKYFAQYWKEYFKVFSSCNNNFRILKERTWTLNNWIWCNVCPKCAFVYSILRPYLTKDEVYTIFWKELYEEKALENLFRELLWIQWMKPFECVGEEKEVMFAMNLVLEKYKKEGISLPYILDIFEKEVKKWVDEDYFNNLEKELFLNYYNETFIPEWFKI